MLESAARSVDVADALTSVLTRPAAGAESVPAVAGPGLNGAPEGGGGCNDPVFVLCCGRSGSTLLRFLLDAHPDLACPPETNMAALCAHLASVWSLLAGTPLPVEPSDEPPVIPGAAIAGIRRDLDVMVGPYLARRGKKRYCDKSLGAAEHADLLVRLFPEAKFVCLYRHPADVIASGIEACPWGLKGFGFDRYAAESPGNAVLALARFWADHAAAIQAVEERFPGRCHRVRYEDLVADPEAVADGIFRFLGVSAQPGISGRCFTPERERAGRADYKIWHTSRIDTSSVGRGWSTPANLIEPAVAARVNELAGKLGYIRIDSTWGVAEIPPDFRVPADGGRAAGTPAAGAGVTQEMPRAFLLLGELLHAGLFRVSDRFIRRWGSCAAESFLVVATSADAGSSAHWRVDLAARTVALASGSRPDDASRTGAAWQINGQADTWERVIRGKTNLNAALRRRDLRYCSVGDAASVGATRMSMLADLLAITSWRSTEPAPQLQVASAR
jgi:hypothetical protein